MATGASAVGEAPASTRQEATSVAPFQLTATAIVPLAPGVATTDGTLGKNVQDFRTYFSPWNGQPPGVPSVVATPGAGGTIAVAVSWNGATEVASWRVLAGSSPATLTPVSSAPKTGFETAISLSAAVTDPYVEVQALDGSGAVIGVSAVVKG